MRSQVWGNVKLDTTGLIDRKVVRFMSDASHLCLSVYGAGSGRRRSGAGSLSE
ncbi:3-oxoacyl-ACP synthase [Salmonella enterica subsp. enterica]|uniref:3-oxoacyl-ACP synthase n=1 Tax=Salmonella enterica I TaxID=59201 RepID=A0A379WPT4_SALET|nr:3-oxoacyl-ACP synthase [Salmonella enterica subsp. enterica]